MSSYYRKQLEDFLAELDVVADRVIDVGGAQLSVRGRVRSWDVKEYAILDLKNPHEKNVPVDVAFDLDEVANTKVEPADIVFCLEVMEYVYDPQMAVMNLRDLTKPDGLLIITFPYFYPPHEPYEMDTLRYTLNGAKRLLTKAGFQIETVKHRECIGMGLNMAIQDNALRPSKRAEVGEVAHSLGFIITAHRT